MAWLPQPLLSCKYKSVIQICNVEVGMAK